MRATAPPLPPISSTTGWDESAARAAERAASDPDLGRCVYASTLLGSRDDLVLHGCGNTSVKRADGDGGVLWVKASGRDLRGAVEADFTALDLAAVRRLLERPRLDDTAMVRELRRAALDPLAPRASVETLTHALLPHRFVLHAHPDALLAATSVPGGAREARRLLPPGFALLPWLPSGAALAHAVGELWRRHAGELRGIVLLHHGIVTFADQAEEAWAALLECVERATATLPPLRSAGAPSDGRWTAVEIATLRHELSRLAGSPLVLTLDDGELARTFAARADVADLARRGPLTPGNVLRTRRTAAVLPHPAAIRATLARWAHDYRAYFRRFAGRRSLTMLDPAPRVLVAPGAGVFAAGPDAAEASATAELWRHTMAAMMAAEALGGYRPLPARQVFDVEYRELQQAKRRRDQAALPLAGRVALVAGAGRGIGRAIADELLAQGAAVAGLDVAAGTASAAFLPLPVDPRRGAPLAAAVEQAARRFGGVDLVIGSGATRAPRTPLDELPLDEWRAVLDSEATAQLALLQAALPLLKRSAHAAVVLLGSRQVACPTAGGAAHAAAKAALTQLGRVAALELGPHGIRVNVLHPDDSPEGVFARDETSIARVAVALCTDLFAHTSGAQVPVDGGRAARPLPRAG